MGKKGKGKNMSKDNRACNVNYGLPNCTKMKRMAENREG